MTFGYLLMTWYTNNHCTTVTNVHRSFFLYIILIIKVICYNCMFPFMTELFSYMRNTIFNAYLQSNNLLFSSFFFIYLFFIYQCTLYYIHVWGSVCTNITKYCESLKTSTSYRFTDVTISLRLSVSNKKCCQYVFACFSIFILANFMVFSLKHP